MNDRLLRRLVALFAIAIAAGGCAVFHSRGGPTAVETGAIRGNQLALVLLRVTGELNGEPAKSAIRMPWPIAIGRAGLDTGGEFKPPFFADGWLIAMARHFARDTLDAGWFYFLLEPRSTHYLAVFFLHSGHMPELQEQARHAPRMRIDVPPDTPVVYVGTFHVRVAERVSTLKKLFNEITIRRPVLEEGGVVIRDESDLARQLASDTVGLLAPPRTVLMQSVAAGTIIFPARSGEPKP